MKTKLISILIILLIAVGAVTLLKSRKKALSQAPVAAVLPVVVDTVTLKPRQITLTLPAMGVVSSDLSTTLSTKVSGRVLKLYRKEGDPVKKGDLLLQIDDRELRTKKKTMKLKSVSLGYDITAKQENLKALQTALTNAIDSHARTKELLDVKGASIEQYDKEKTAIAQLKAKIQSMKSAVSMLRSGISEIRQNENEIDTLLSYTVLKSPVNGTLSARMVQPGDLALPGKPLLKIAATDGLYLDIRLPSDLDARMILYKNKTFPLTPKNQAGISGLREYRTALPLGSALVEGEFLNIALVLYTGQGILLPNDVLLSTENETSVLVYEKGQATKVPVTMIRRGSEGVMVKENLAGKTLLLAKPDILLRATTGVPIKLFSHANN
ncbi:MAG: hypothetical protein DSY90_02600 [Deltaproteobacteria bacterium]|nr:MAG: hypothetical protein DSY90_02600 [Deltaproteobacteria bacterium]